MSFKNLERFKISVGSSLNGSSNECKHSFQNTLELVISKYEILETKIYELFEKADELCLSVDGMNDLEDIVVKPLQPLRFSSFYNLRNLVVWKCAVLKYLFTLGVAKALSKLEHLQVYDCNNMKALIHTKGGGEETIRFPKLKFLALRRLPRLACLCDDVNILELPQLASLNLEGLTKFTSYTQNQLDKYSFFSEEAVIPKLEKLQMDDMKNLKAIWPCDFSIREVGKLRRIEVSYCRNLVNIFPCNPMPLLHHLEELQVWDCGSIEALFEIDLDSLGETGKVNNGSLRSIEVNKLFNLRQVWKIKGESNSLILIPSFKAIERIEITKCLRFTHLWTPTNISFDLGALVNLKIINNALRLNDNLEEDTREEKESDIVLKKEASQVINIKSNIAFPSFLTHSFHNLCTLVLEDYEGVEVVFEIESPTSRELTTPHHNQRRLLPYLKELDISSMDNMSHVWKCIWNKFLILQKQPSESPFHNLTTIKLVQCSSIKYLFSPLMAKLFSNLRKVQMACCSKIEEVVSNRDDEDEEKTTFTSTSTHTGTTLFPHLDSLTLDSLHSLKCIGGGGAKDGNNELYFNDITTTTRLDQSKFPQMGGVSWSLCQYAREITILYCSELSSVIPCYPAGQRQKLQVLSIMFCPGMKEIFETQENNNNNSNKSGSDEGNGSTPELPRLNNVVMLPNLKILFIHDCERLEHIFTFSTLESLRHLEELRIEFCKGMKVIVKEEDDKEQTTTASSKEVVVFPRLKSIELKYLPELGGFFLGKNEFLWPSLDKTPFPSLCPATSEGMPWSSHNLIELHVMDNDVFEHIITSNNMLQLQKLETIDVSYCNKVQEVFEALEGGTNSCGFDESQTTLLKLPNLTQVNLKRLKLLRHIWKSNHWTAFEFPNLTTVTINDCRSLKHVFTSSMAGSLLQLQKLHITDCIHMEEVFGKDTNVAVEEEEKESDGKMNEYIMFPHLKSLELRWLSCLKGFCLGKDNFSFPLLGTLEIKYCPAITIFTNGNSATPELKAIETSFKSLYAAGEDINSIIKTNQEEIRRRC